MYRTVCHKHTYRCFVSTYQHASPTLNLRVLPLQLFDAKPSAVWGQGLDAGLPSAPLMHLTVRQCAAEA